MFDAEKLLGKVVGEVLNPHGQNKKKKTSSLLGGLTSGAGLMTMVGLGVGAFEILKDRSPQTAPTTVPGGVGMPRGAASMPPPAPGAGPPPPPSVAAPPLPPGTTKTPPLIAGAEQDGAPTPAPPSPAPGQAEPGSSDVDIQRLALQMIRVMIAAAHSDGQLDEAEERAILDRLKGAGLTQEERLFMLEELHAPRSIAELTDGIGDAATARTMYLLAYSAVTVDTEEERLWLDQLAAALGISRQVARFLEEEA
jgi:hypothetical protein